MRTVALNPARCLEEFVRRLRYCFFFLFFALLVPSLPAFAELQRFAFNSDESQITARVNDPFGNVVNGRLRLRHGEARGDPERLQETAAVTLVIDSASYNSGVGLRDQDVQEYYLEIQQYPVIRFDSTGIQKIERPAPAKEPWRITLRGRLDLHGVQREIIVPLRILYQGNKIAAEGSFRLLLEQFKISAPRLLFLQAGNEVQVDFRIVGERQP
jgi:polyisoprenoid-binding protein YceI